MVDEEDVKDDDDTGVVDLDEDLETQGRTTIPSVVLLRKGGRITSVGYDALAEWDAYLNDDDDGSACLVGSTKRLIGRDKDDTNMPQKIDNFPYQVLEKRNGDRGAKLAIKVRGDTGFSVTVTPEDVACAILKAIKTQAEQQLKQKLSEAVITVPAYFNESQRAATKVAGEMAGFNVLRTISEPMAAAITYGLAVAGSKRVMVLDLGGGTFDISILQINQGKHEAIGIGGDPNIGGDDIDDLLMTYVLEKTKRGGSGKHARNSKAIHDLSPAEITTLRRSCERAKIKLSKKQNVVLTHGNKQIVLTQDTLRTIIKPLLEKCREKILELLREVKLKVEDIHEIVLVGLSTKTPAFREMVQNVFNGKELCVSISADQAVSHGAAIQAAIMVGEDQYRLAKILMLDALPYSVGLEGLDGSMQVLLQRNSPIPSQSSRIFRTSRDGQPALSIDIFEGEDPIARNNHWIGSHDFVIPNGRKYKAGERSLKVTFQVTADGVLFANAEPPENEAELAKIPEWEETLRVIILVLGLIVLIGLYLAFRIFVPFDESNLLQERHEI